MKQRFELKQEREGGLGACSYIVDRRYGDCVAVKFTEVADHWAAYVCASMNAFDQQGQLVIEVESK